MRWKYTLRSTISVVSMLALAPLAMAQSSSVNVEESEGSTSQPPIEAKTKLAPKNVERIKVTGSHIKRIDIEGASPVMVLDRKDLERSGYNSVSDVLRDSTAASFGATRESSGLNSAGFASVGLRGMGPSRTLILLNGRRLPSDGARGSVDLNLIPMAAVERIDILKDGASATYGSDALGGVINIITVKDFQGTELSVTGNFSEFENSDGTRTTPEKFSASLINGVKLGKVNLVNVANYRKNSKVFARDRPWSNNKFSPTSFIPSFSGYDELKVDGNPKPNRDFRVASGTCPPEFLTPNGRTCEYRYSDHSTTLPELSQSSIMSTASTNFGDTEVSLRGSYIQKSAAYTYAPSPGKIGIPNGSTAAFPNGAAGAAGLKGVIVSTRLVEAGNRETEIITNAGGLDLTASTEVGETWEVEYGVGYNKIHRLTEGVNGPINKDILSDLIKRNVFDVTRNPGERGDLSSAKFVSSQNMVTVLQSAQVMANGEVFETNAGPWGLAVGATHSKSSYYTHLDDISAAGKSFDSAGAEGGGVRAASAMISELSVPVTQQIEMQVAARYDTYSDFGDTVNPKLGVKYQPTSKLLFRASVGTGFKAPTMNDMYEASSKGYPHLQDPNYCKKDPENGCNYRQIETTSGGNPGLEEEKSVSYNIGTVYQATRDASFGFDVWKTTLDNVVGNDIQETLIAEAKGIPLPKGYQIVRDSDGKITEIVAPMQNLASRDVFGIDLSQNMKMGKFRFGVIHSHIFHYLEEVVPGGGEKNTIRTDSKPQWRNTISLGVMPTANHDISFAWRTIASSEKASKDYGRLPQYSELDFNYKYQGFKYAELSFGVTNLLGTTPPLDDTPGSLAMNTNLYSELGTVSYLSAKAIF